MLWVTTWIDGLVVNVWYAIHDVAALFLVLDSTDWIVSLGVSALRAYYVLGDLREGDAARSLVAAIAAWRWVTHLHNWYLFLLHLGGALCITFYRILISRSCLKVLLAYAHLGLVLVFLLSLLCWLNDGALVALRRASLQVAAAHWERTRLQIVVLGHDGGGQDFIRYIEMLAFQ